MAFNNEDFIRIRDEYSRKYLKAHRAADARAEELYSKIPELRRLDGLLAVTASKIIRAFDSDNPTISIEIVKSENEKLMAQRAALLKAFGYPEDYTDVKYDCPTCGDTGYVGTKMCACMKRALVTSGYESSGISGLMRSQSFENFSLDFYRDTPENYDNMSLMTEKLKKYAEEFSDDTYKNLLFIGKTGLGKTHLSTSIATKIIENGYDVYYVSACKLISDFEAKQFGYGSDKPVNTSRYFSSDLLIIDDFGTELTNQFTVSCIYNIINERIIARRSTLINTNLSKSDIASRYGDRIASRLFGEYLPIVFRGNDIRGQKINQKI